MNQPFLPVAPSEALAAIREAQAKARARDRACEDRQAALEAGHAFKDAIIREMIKAMKHLGAKSDLLGIVCSYGETLDDEMVLSELQFWNTWNAEEKGVDG